MTTAAARRRSGSTKADIVDAGAALFAERGFAAVGVQEIAERVGITGGAIYRHFPSKDAVLDAVLVESITAWLGAAQPAASDGEEPVRRIVSRSVQLVVDHPGHWRRTCASVTGPAGLCGPSWPVARQRCSTGGARPS